MGRTRRMGDWPHHVRAAEDPSPRVQRAPRAQEATATPRGPLRRGAQGPRRRAGASGLPRQAALHALLLAARRRPRADDRPPGGRPDAGGRRAAALADDAAAHPRGRQGHDSQDPVAAVRRGTRRVGADALPRPGHDVRLVAGRLRHGLPVLCHRSGRAPAEHVCRRDRRAGRRRRPLARAWRGARRDRSRQQRGLHGHGRADGQLQGRHRSHPQAHRQGARRPRHVGSRHHRSRRSAWSLGSTSSPTRGSRSPWRCRCTPRTTSCATSWSRSTPAGRCTRPSRRPGATPVGPSAVSRSSTP